MEKQELALQAFWCLAEREKDLVKFYYQGRNITVSVHGNPYLTFYPSRTEIKHKFFIWQSYEIVHPEEINLYVQGIDFIIKDAAKVKEIREKMIEFQEQVETERLKALCQ